MNFDVTSLIEIENDHKFLEYRFAYKDIPVWPFVRWNVFEYMKYNLLPLHGNKSQGLSKGILSNDNIGSMMRKALYGVINFPFFSKKKSIMFLYGCTANVVDENGELYNRCFDEFVKIYPDNTYVLECGERDIGKRSQVSKHYSYWIDKVIDNLAYKMEPDGRDVKMADSFLNYLLKKLSMPYTLDNMQVKLIRHIILFYSKKVKYQDIFYRKLFQFIKPKIVFLEDGCYGERNAYLCKILKELKITSAEIQHGIAPGQAYNYGELIRESREYSQYMPDYYCGMSDLWLNQINANVKKVCLGNPEFWKKYNKFYEKSKAMENIRTKKTILWLPFIDERMDMDLLESFLKNARAVYHILLRHHPLLKGREKHYRNLVSKYQELEVDNSATVYDALVESDFVVSDDSTVIYEALAFEKRVFVCDCPQSHYAGTIKYGECFKSANELLELLNVSRKYGIQDKEAVGEQFFAKQWENNYKAFIKRVIKNEKDRA